MNNKLKKHILEKINCIEAMNGSTEDTENIVLALAENIKLHFHIEIISGRIHLWLNSHFDSLTSVKEEKSFVLNFSIQKLLNKNLVDPKLVNKVHAQLCNDYYLTEDFYPDEIAINVKNGTLVIWGDGFEIIPHDPIYGMRYTLNHEYDPYAKAPKFIDFLQDVIVEKQSIVVILEYLGYIFLKNKLNLEKCLVFLGEGRNGKSVLLSIIVALFGKENVSNLEMEDLSDPNKIAMLDGKLVNTGTDSSSKNLKSSNFKKLVSGEPIIGKILYQDHIVIDDLPRFIFAMNNLPFAEGDTSLGFLRRLSIIEFNKIIPKEKVNPYLADELKKELPGILNLAIRGAKRLLKRKRFTESKKINSSLESYEKDINVVKNFVEEYQISHNPKGRVPNQKIYEVFKDWTTKQGIKTKNLRYLTKKLRSHGFEQYKNDTIYGFRIDYKDLETSSNIHQKAINYKKMTDEELFEED